MFEITDDGVGGADAGQGSGLRGLADRVAALDGTLSLESPAGQGTRLHVEIPCEPLPESVDRLERSAGGKLQTVVADRSAAGTPE
jgi:glucose-6-phosphate-specific signal transduction histidine kinase